MTELALIIVLGVGLIAVVVVRKIRRRKAAMHTHADAAMEGVSFDDDRREHPHCD